MGNRVIAAVATLPLLFGCRPPVATAGFWYSNDTFALPAHAAEKLGGPLTGAELESIKQTSRAEVEHAFAGMKVNITYAPPGATRQTIVDGIGRGIGRVAAHEFAHQMINSGETHNPRDENSYEYPSSDRAAQYYGELRWTTGGCC